MSFAIGDLARCAGYAVQTVRYYEQTGLMPEPPRTDGRQRRYGEAHLKRLLFIRHARDLGFEVADIRSLLDLAARPDQSCASVDSLSAARREPPDRGHETTPRTQGEVTTTRRRKSVRFVGPWASCASSAWFCHSRCLRRKERQSRCELPTWAACRLAKPDGAIG